MSDSKRNTEQLRELMHEIEEKRETWDAWSFDEDPEWSMGAVLEFLKTLFAEIDAGADNGDDQ